MLEIDTYIFSRNIKHYKSTKHWNRSIENPNGAPRAAIPYCSTIEAERTWYCGPFDIIDTSWLSHTHIIYSCQLSNLVFLNVNFDTLKLYWEWISFYCRYVLILFADFPDFIWKDIYSKRDFVQIVWKLGWSIETSALENPRPRPQSSRVFEVKGSLFFKFRGFSSLREPIKSRT